MRDTALASIGDLLFHARPAEFTARSLMQDLVMTAVSETGSPG